MEGYRAAIYRPREIGIEKFDIPCKQEPGFILVEIQYSLVSPGTELRIYNSPPKQTFYPGYTAVGTVLETGKREDNHLKGKKVFLFPALDDDVCHCHSTHTLFKTSGLAIPLSTGLDPREACFSRMINIALTPYCNADPKIMGTVLVIGLGMVGNLVGQIGRIRGFYTIGIESNATRRRRALDSGFDVVLDPKEGNLIENVKSVTNGRGADLTVNAAGETSLFIFAVQATASGGEISTLGGAPNSVQGDLAVVFSEVHARHLTIRGGWELNLPMRTAYASKVSSSEMNIDNAFRWLANRAVNLKPLWTHTIKPNEFKKTFDALNQKDDSYLGIIVDWKNFSQNGLGNINK